ncbi:MAG: ATP-binding protein [Treponema sp.]|nr:ATP-binding protein [Treponema sp.]
MLLEFKTKNYKSFKDEVVFSMIPAPKQKGLDYSILKKTAGKKEYKALCSSVVYGANAAGKSNIVSAIQTFKSIVLNGNINNKKANVPNAAETNLELIPNNACKSNLPEPVSFFIKFIHKSMLFEYSLDVDLGFFLDENYKRSVKNEILKIDEKEIFRRNGKELNVNEKILKFFDENLVSKSPKNLKIVLSISEESLNERDLFLCNGFKTIISSGIYDAIYEYFSLFLNSYYHSFSVNMVPSYMDKFYEDSFLNEAAKCFGIYTNKLVFVRPDNPAEMPVLCSVMDNKRFLPSITYESYGTVRFVNILPMLAQTLVRGGTIVLDEFDPSLHPMVIMNILNIFHNDEINKNHAQIIFNTQNPIFLNNNLFRRDEIKFVERSDETNCSELYSLSDFGTKGANARKGKDYMDNYFMNKYGAIKDIDLSGIILKQMEKYGDSKASK